MNNVTETNRKSATTPAAFLSPFWGVSGVQRQIAQIMDSATAFANLGEQWVAFRQC